MGCTFSSLSIQSFQCVFMSREKHIFKKDHPYITLLLLWGGWVLHVMSCQIVFNLHLSCFHHCDEIHFFFHFWSVGGPFLVIFFLKKNRAKQCAWGLHKNSTIAPEEIELEYTHLLSPPDMCAGKQIPLVSMGGRAKGQG